MARVELLFFDGARTTRRILVAFAAGAAPRLDDPGGLAELEQHDLIGRGQTTGDVVVAIRSRRARPRTGSS